MVHTMAYNTAVFKIQLRHRKTKFINEKWNQRKMITVLSPIGVGNIYTYTHTYILHKGLEGRANS